MASILAKLGLDTGDFKKGLDSTGTHAKKFADGFGKVIASGIKVASVAIGAFAIKGTKDLIEFEKGINEVFTLMPDITEKAMTKMQSDVRGLAVTMGLDLTDAVNSTYQAISAGIDPDNAITFLETASKTAIAGVASLEDSVGALTTIINGYGMEASEASRVSDVLFSVVKNGVTSMTELGQNVGKVTPLASALGVSIEEVGAMFVVLTKQMGSGKTAEAGTAIRSMLAELGKAGMKASDNFDRLSGQSFPDFIKSGGSVTDALMILKNGAVASGESMMDMFRGIEAGASALMLVTNNGKELSKQFKNITSDAGATDKAFERMSNTASQQLAQVMASFKELGIKFGESFLPIIKKHLPDFQKAIENSAPAMTRLAETMVTIGKKAVSLAPLLLKIVTALTAFTIITKVVVMVKSLSVALKGVAPHLTALVAGFALGKIAGDNLALAWKLLTGEIEKEWDAKHLDDLTNKAKEIVPEIQTLEEQIKSMKKALADLDEEDALENLDDVDLSSPLDNLKKILHEAKRWERIQLTLKEDAEKFSDEDKKKIEIEVIRSFMIVILS